MMRTAAALSFALLVSGCCRHAPEDSGKRADARAEESAAALQAHLKSDALLLAGTAAYVKGEWKTAKERLDSFLRANPGHPLKGEIMKMLAQIEIDRNRSGHLETMTRSGYSPVTVGDLIVTPEEHYGKKIVFSGFYSGQGLDVFFVYPRFAKGGNIRVDGSGIEAAPEEKKELLASLDGFHRVLVKGVLLRPEKPRRSGRMAGSALGSYKPRPHVRAEGLIDLGRGDPQRN